MPLPRAWHPRAPAVPHGQQPRAVSGADFIARPDPHLSPLAPEPRPEIRDRTWLPYLVEHWFLGPRARHYMVVRRFREVLAHARLEPGQRVLDLGCGWAYGTLWAADCGTRAVGVDLESDQLRWARASLDPERRLSLAQANATNLPFRRAAFDCVFSVEMMEHVFRPDRPRVLSEIARVTRPGGRLALSTPNAASPIELVKRAAVRWPWLRRSLPSSCFPEAEDDQANYHPYRYHHPIGLTELERGLEEVGFRVEGAKRFLWVMKTLPDPLLPAGRAAEALAESLPLVRDLGATTLIWAVRR